MKEYMRFDVLNESIPLMKWRNGKCIMFPWLEVILINNTMSVWFDGPNPEMKGFICNIGSWASDFEKLIGERMVYVRMSEELDRLAKYHIKNGRSCNHVTHGYDCWEEIKRSPYF